MATRKKKKIDIGAIASNTIFTGIGGVTARAINAKVMPDMNPYIKNFLLIGLGSALPLFVKDNPIIKSVGNGLIAGGSIGMAEEMMPDLVATPGGSSVSYVGKGMADYDDEMASYEEAAAIEGSANDADDALLGYEDEDTTSPGGSDPDSDEDDALNGLYGEYEDDDY